MFWQAQLPLREVDAIAARHPCLLSDASMLCGRSLTTIEHLLH